jgi:hypothetical protein
MNIRTNAEIKSIVENKGYKLIKIYRKGIKKDIRVIIRDISGYKYDVLIGNFKKFNSCRVGRNNPFTNYNIKLWLKLNKPQIKLKTKTSIVSATEKVLFYHFICKENFLMNWQSMAIKNCGCPICNGKQVGKYNNLKYLYPDIAKEWSNKNKILSNEITPNSGKSFIWECSVCGKNWESRVADRVRNQGCPRCKISKGEKEIEQWLIMNKIKHIREKRFDKCRNERPLPFDFYLLDYITCVEYHGEQHYKVLRNNIFGGEKELIARKRNDKIKRNYCKENNIKIIVISYKNFLNIKHILSSKIGILK